MAIYQIFNGLTPTTAKFVAVTTGTSIKTLLQVSTSATAMAKVIEWGIRVDAPASSALFVAELLETDVAATVTAHVTAGLNKLDASALSGGDPVTNLLPVGTAATGFTSTAEGSITAVRLFDSIVQTIPSSNGYEFVKQFPLGREPILQISKFGRIRVHCSVAMNAVCYMTVEV